MIVDFKTNNYPAYNNPRKATIFQKILLLFKKEKISVDENESCIVTTHYKTLKDCMFIIAFDYKRK